METETTILIILAFLAGMPIGAFCVAIGWIAGSIGYAITRRRDE